MSGRLFLRRWNLRVLRIEWRQHAVIFVLMLSGVMLAIASVLAAYNLVAPPQSEFGNGQFSAVADDDPEGLANALEAGGHSFAAIESATLQVTGTAQRVDARAADATNPVFAPLVAVVAGRLPTDVSEVAVSDRAVVDIGVGDALTLAGVDVRVVGVVENPTDLGDEFVLLSSFRSHVDAEVSTQFLVDADPGSVQFPGVRGVSTTTAEGPSARTAATLAVNVVSAFGLLEIGLLVGAGFGVIARRRMHQFGLLAAVGATPRQLRSAATGVGFLLGVLAATTGAVLAMLLMRTLLPQMEGAIGHRIAFSVPWPAVVVNMVLAVVVASLGARLPARSLSTEPVAHLLVAQRPRRESVGRPAIVGVVVATLGAASLAAGFAQLNMLFAVLGVLLAPIGLLLMAPLLVRVLARTAGSLSLAPRLAARSVGRHNRRSASVVAALALALAVPIGLVVVTSSIDARRIDQGPNLAENWFVAWQPGADDSSTRIPAELDADVLVETSARIADAAPELTLTPIEVAVARDGFREVWDFDTIGSRPSIEPLFAARRGSSNCLVCSAYGFGETDENGDEIVWLVEDAWIATPELAAVLGVETPEEDVAAISETADLRPLSVSGSVDGEVVVRPDWPRNARVPRLLISESIADAAQYERVSIGLFASGADPISEETRDLIRATVGPDMVLEFHEPPAPNSGLRAAALLAGMALGVGICLAAVSLLTVELADDLAVLQSLGAPPVTTRRLAASVTAIVAVAGSALALLIGYVALIPLLTAKEIDFPLAVPWRSLTAVLVVFPAIAAAAGWLGGRRTAASATS